MTLPPEPHRIGIAPGDAWRATRTAALGIVALCGVVAAANFIELRIITAAHGPAIASTELFVQMVPRWIVLAGLMVLVLALARRVPIWPLTLRVTAIHAAGFAGVALAQAVMVTSVQRALVHHAAAIPFWFNVWAMVIHTLPLLVLLYAATLGAARLADATLERHARNLREAQLHAELSTARLAALRAQLHPHFLYNSLNGIAALIADDQRDSALAATEQLGELLHAAFRDDGRTMIPFAEELALVDRYLVLQQLRFADRLTVTRSVAPGLDQVLVPPLLLQPLVENAVQHSLAGPTGGVAIRLAARTDGDRLEVEIENDGPRLGPGWDQAAPRGVGIPNTSTRLRTLYGDAAGLRLAPREAGGMLATVWLPLRMVPSS